MSRSGVIFTQIGDLEYAQLWKDVLTPCIPSLIDAQNKYSVACRDYEEPNIVQPHIIPDVKRYEIGEQFVSELKNCVISGETIGKIGVEYDKNLLTTAPVSTHSDYADAVVEKVREIKIVNSPPKWLVSKIAQDEHPFDYKVCSNHDEYEDEGFKMTDVGGVELKDSRKDLQVGVFLNPSYYRNKHTAVVDVKIIDNVCELLFYFKGDLKVRYLSRSASMYYYCDPRYRDILFCSYTKHLYEERAVLSHAIGDYYVGVMAVKGSHNYSVAQGRFPFSYQGSNNYGVTRSEGRFTVETFEEYKPCRQFFQSVPAMYPQICIPGRVSSMSCAYQKYVVGVYCATDCILPDKVKFFPDVIELLSGEVLTYGNLYLYLLTNIDYSGEYLVCDMKLMDSEYVFNYIRKVPYHLDNLPDEEKIAENIDMWEEFL